MVGGHWLLYKFQWYLEAALGFPMNAFGKFLQLKDSDGVLRVAEANWEKPDLFKRYFGIIVAATTLLLGRGYWALSS